MVVAAIDVTAVPPHPAGAGRYIVELARRAATREDVVLAVVARRDDAARWRELTPAAEVAAVAPSGRALRLAWEELVLGRAVGRAAVGGRPVEVLHAPHYSMPLRSPVPVVVTVHDLTFVDHPEWHERSKVVVFTHALRRAARRADAVVCVSAATRDRFVDLYRPSCPVHVVPHGVDTATFAAVEASPGADAPLLAGLGVRAPYVLHVGTLEPRKDVPTLLRAFDRIAGRQPGLSLVLAGTPGWGEEEVVTSLATLEHRQRVLRLGWVAEAALPALLRGAAVVAYPSRAEGFGLPALEALACGAPLVTTAGTVMDQLVGDAALLVSAGDAGSLAGALEAALGGGPDVARRRALGLAAAGAHDWEASVAAHVAVYADVASTAAGRGPGRRRSRANGPQGR